MDEVTQLASFRHGVADLLLTRLGIKYLLVELKFARAAAELGRMPPANPAPAPAYAQLALALEQMGRFHEAFDRTGSEPA